MNTTIYLPIAIHEIIKFGLGEEKAAKEEEKIRVRSVASLKE